MSNRDPSLNGMCYRLNPAVNDFAPGCHNGSQQQNGISNQVSTPPSPYLEARVFNLEEEHASLRGDIDTLKELYHGLSFSVDKLKKGGWPVHVGPFQDVDVAQSHQSATQFKLELEKLSREAHKSVDGGADVQKANGMAPPKVTGSVPPHMRSPSVTSNGTVSKSLPPHLRNAKKAAISNGNGVQEHSAHGSSNSPLATDGQVDKAYQEEVPAPVPSPPLSPATTIQPNLPPKNLSLDNAWKPHYLTTLPTLHNDILSKIPAGDMVTFHPDFIRNNFDGVTWSPGLRFIKGSGPCILKNRTYYLLDPASEPFLPKAPGEHGAKLTAFFNKAPEEEFADLLDEGSNSYEDVPMFIMIDNRYVYFGNYSQTRWSDKLDYDSMKAQVPQRIKEYWAEELTATAREEWVTEELKKHFFRKPEYEGRLYAAPNDETTVNSEEEIKNNDKMVKDVKKYVEELREWEREAKMKTSMIKKQFILDAFDAADADDPPALRLWWEYLECVDWKKDFYDLLVTLQSRDAKTYL